jgi:HlyD family secretion protein
MAMAFVPWRNESEELLDVSPMDRLVRSHWFTRRRAFIALSLLAAFALIVFVTMRYVTTRTVSLPIERVAIAPVERGSFEDYVPVTGNVQPRETVYLDAIDGGQVTEVFTEEGAFVAPGQPLVRLTNTNLQLQVINSEAQLSEQLNRLTSTKLLFEQTKLTHARELIDTRFLIEQARQRLARLQPIEHTGAVKRSEIEDMKLELLRLERLEKELARAAAIDERLQREQIQQLDRAVEGLNANLDLARQNLENLVVKAPFAGHLTSLDAHLGESKLPGQRLGQVDRVDGFKVVALVDEHYLARVTAGQDALAEIDGQEHPLRLAKVYPEVRNRQFKVDLAFIAAPPESVRRGQSLQLRLKIGASREGLIVANGAFYEDTGGQWAFVLDEDDIAERRVIQTGRRNPEQIEILSGVEVGERIITSSYETLKEIDRIVLRGP